MAQLNLPILLGIVRQRGATGELVLEQNDGTRKFRFQGGELASLRSDATGEQLGSWLLRQGLLDLPALTALLASEERRRIGEKLVHDGRMTAAQRNAQLQELQEQVMVHALEHPVLRWTWNALELPSWQVHDPEFQLQDRHLIWRAMQGYRQPEALAAFLEAEDPWQWCGKPDLLDSLGDLPLTPGTAYAVTLIGADPIGFRTFCYLSQLDRLDAARLVATLWALGALTLTAGVLPDLVAAAPAPAPSLAAPTPPRLPPLPEPAVGTAPLPLIPPPTDSPFGPPKKTAARTPAEPAFEVLDVPEFLDPESEILEDPGLDERIQALQDVPPSGSKPSRLPGWLTAPVDPRATPARPLPLPREMGAWPADLPPTGPSPRATNPPGAPLPAARSEPSPRASNPLGAPLPVPSSTGLQPPTEIALDLPGGPIELDLQPKGAAAPPSMEVSAIQARAGRLLAQAKRQAQMGRTVEATRTLEEAVDLQPEGDVAYDAWMMLGRLRMNNPSWAARAIHAFQNAALLRPKETEPLLVMADLLRRTGAEADAETCLKRARGLDPSAHLPGPQRPGRPR